jgi:hypothetical protein
LKKNTFLPLLLLVALALTSCTRSASTPVPDEALLQSETLFPVATQLGATLPAAEPHIVTQAAVQSEATATPLILIPTSETVAEATQEQAQPDVIIPVSTEGLPGGCDPNITPYQGLGPGSPTVGICGVVQDISVTIQTNDFIAGQSYTVYMTPFESGGVAGIVIGTFNTNSGGRYIETYPIPDALRGVNKIAIRLVFSSGWEAYNYFYN